TRTRLGGEVGNEVDHILATFRLGSVADLPAAVARSRRLLDLDADPESFGSVLGADEVIARLVRSRPGLRAPGAVDGAERASLAGLRRPLPLGGDRMKYTHVDTPIGKLTVVAGGTGIRRILWDGEAPPEDAVEGHSDLLDAAVTQIREYFTGNRTTFDLPLDL